MATLLGILSAIVVVGTFVLWFRRIRQVRIPADRTIWVVSALTGAALGAFALASAPGWIGGLPAVFAVLVGTLFVVLVGISAQRTEGAIDVGDAVPDVSAPDDTGATVALADFRGQPALYKFFRGHW